MAGSYRHVVYGDNSFYGIGTLDHMGDAEEAIEEMYFMINHLAGGDLSKIFEAHRAYVASHNPEYAKTMKQEDYWDKDDLPGAEHD